MLLVKFYKMDLELEEISNIVNLDINVLCEIIKRFKYSFISNIDISNIINAVTELMKIVGKVKKVSGNDKKIIVTKLLIYMVKETDTGEFDEIMDSVLINIIPVAIDKLVSVEKGKLIFNKKIKKLFRC